MADEESTGASGTAAASEDVEMEDVSALKEQAKEQSAQEVANGDDQEAEQEQGGVDQEEDGSEGNKDEEKAANGTAANGDHDKSDDSVKVTGEVQMDNDDEAAVDEALEEMGDVEEEEEVIEDEEDEVQEIEDEEDEEEEMEMMRVENGEGMDSNSAIELNDEDDDEDDDEVEEIDGDEQPKMVNGAATGPPGAGERTSRRKSPVRLREIEEVNDSEDDDSNDVEEVKDDDSDVMEVEAEDPLGASAAPAAKSSGASSTSSSSASSSRPPSTSVVTSSSKPNVVTIDDVKTLHKLAASTAALKRDSDSSKNNLVLIDTNSILAGKATSGVTITPARPKTGSNGLGGSGSGLSGVTISSTSKQGRPVPLNKAGDMGASPVNSSFTYNNKGQLNDPNLTDDTFVVEAPSFIVPYVYEKPPKESFSDFKDSLKKMVEELKKKEKEEKEKEKKEGEEDKEGKDDEDSESAKKDGEKKDGDKKDDDDEVKSVKSGSSDDIVELDKGGQPKTKSENYFESSLGKFVMDLGMNLVQETVQSDLLRQQINRSKKDKSAAVMHAIMSLKKNLETSKENNEMFRFKERKCRFCSFRTESEVCMQHHLETPHMKQFMYRCNFCPYETKLPAEVLAHMGAKHGVRGRLERAPAIHQCPQCPFEDNMKGKLTRHKTSCDKRFRQERNQEAPHDWEPPAKIPKPPVIPRRPNYGMGGMGQGAYGQSLAQMAMRQGQNRFGNFGMGQQQGQKSIYSNMPSLQMGPRGRGRPVGAYKPDMMGGSPLGGMGRQGKESTCLIYVQ